MVDFQKPESLTSRPAFYQIRVQGRLTSKCFDLLQGMTAKLIEMPDWSVVTELTGFFPDQATMMGVLQYLYTKLIPIISLECQLLAAPHE